MCPLWKARWALRSYTQSGKGGKQMTYVNALKLCPAHVCELIMAVTHVAVTHVAATYVALPMWRYLPRYRHIGRGHSPFESGLPHRR